MGTSTITKGVSSYQCSYFLRVVIKLQNFLDFSRIGRFGKPTFQRVVQFHVKINWNSNTRCSNKFWTVIYTPSKCQERRKIRESLFSYLLRSAYLTSIWRFFWENVPFHHRKPENPILRWNFFPSGEMVFSRSIWDLKWLLTTRACGLHSSADYIRVRISFFYFFRKGKRFPIRPK